MKAVPRPEAGEAISQFNTYISKATGSDLFQALNKASDRLWETVYRIPTGFADHRYAEGKWSIKEVFQHVLDSERIFCYRALCFARNDATELPGFDENAYAANADTSHRELHELLREHDLVRAATMALFRGFSEEMLLRSGVANGKRISVRAIGWTIAGHVTHHMDVIDERYLTHTRA
jgi:uncharacterized damage-inducible protein DinB